jgi:hypothetical protein
MGGRVRGYAFDCHMQHEKKPISYYRAYVPRSRENTHELFKRLERLTSTECDIHFLEFLEVGSERSKVIWVIPLPRRRLRNVSIHGQKP